MNRFAVGRVLVAAGSVLLLLLVYELTVASIPQQRSQRELLATFRDDLQSAAADAAAAAGGSDEESGLLTADSAAGLGGETEQKTFEPAPPAPKTGDPVAMVKIPSIGVQQVVVEGTSGSELGMGPGHYRNTPMPGQSGNSAIAGARTSKGAPFRHLDQLAEGDKVVVVTRQGTFDYVVDGRKVLTADDPDPVQPLRQNRLTLITSNPAFRGTDRLVVTAALVGRPVARPAGWYPTAGREDESGFAPTPGALPWTLVWGAAVAAAFVFAARLYRTWKFGPAWVVTTPILLLVLVLFFEAASGLLPATF